MHNAGKSALSTKGLTCRMASHSPSARHTLLSARRSETDHQYAVCPSRCSLKHGTPRYDSECDCSALTNGQRCRAGWERGFRRFRGPSSKCCRYIASLFICLFETFMLFMTWAHIGDRSLWRRLMRLPSRIPSRAAILHLESARVPVTSKFGVTNILAQSATFMILAPSTQATILIALSHFKCPSVSFLPS